MNLEFKLSDSIDTSPFNSPTEIEGENAVLFVINSEVDNSVFKLIERKSNIRNNTPIKWEGPDTNKKLKEDK